MPVPTQPRRRLLVIAGLAIATAVVLLAAPLLLMGPSEPEDNSYVDGPVIAAADRGQAWPLAGVSGRLTQEEGCLMIADFPVQWPNGTSWDATTREVVFSDGTRLGLGSTLRGGGGSYGPEDLALEPRTIAAAATLECIRRTDSNGYQFAYPGQLLNRG